MNAKIDKDEKINSVNTALQTEMVNLAVFSFKNRLVYLNTKFQIRKGKLWTSTKSHLDYIFINKKWINNTINCEVYFSFEGVSSDHRIVSEKSCLSLCKNKKRTSKSV